MLNYAHVYDPRRTYAHDNRAIKVFVKYLERYFIEKTCFVFKVCFFQIFHINYFSKNKRNGFNKEDLGLKKIKD